MVLKCRDKIWLSFLNRYMDANDIVEVESTASDVVSEIGRLTKLVQL